MELDHGSLSNLLETAVVAARLAGQKAMEKMEYVKAYTKSSGDIVTAADSECQKIIIDRIRETFPDHGFLAEESENDEMFHLPPRGKEDFWWVIDPIDGTTNYSNKLPIFAVSIAVFHQGSPAAAVIFQPSTENMFTAFKDGFAQLNARRIKPSDKPLDNLSCIGLNSRYSDGIPSWAETIIQDHKFRNLGSVALQLAYVANGGLQGTFVNGAKLWDIAAGAMIAQVAGAKVTDYQGNDIFPVDLENYKLKNISVISAAKNVHDQLLNMIN